MKAMYWTVAVALVVAAGTPANAQNRAMGSFGGYFTPFLGAVAGGEVNEARITFGATVAVHEQNGWGAELDFSHAGDVESGALVLDANTYMVTASWMKPDGLVRPYGAAGGGVIQLEGCGFCNRSSRTYDFGWTAGAGVLALVNDSIAMRGDARYFFSGADHFDLQRPDSVAFWRVSVGLTLMWVMVP